MYHLFYACIACFPLVCLYGYFYLLEGPICFSLLRVVLVDLTSREAISYYIVFPIHELWCLRTPGQHQHCAYRFDSHYRDVR